MFRNLAAFFLIGVLLSIFAYFKIEKEQLYRVLRVVEGDKFYVDLNADGKEGNDELLHLNFANSFPIRYSHKTSEYANKFNLTIPEIISLGYGAREFSSEQLSGKFVTLKELDDFNPEYSYRFGCVFLNGKDYSKLLLENGFGFSYSPKGYDYYKNSENLKKIKENSKILMAKKIMLVDAENKTYHELNCPKILKIKNQKLLPLKEIAKGFRKCKYCDLNFNFENELVKIESPNPNLRVGDVELFLVNPNNYELPTSRCRTNACQALLKNINSAKTSIHFAVYGFDRQDEIFNALKNARTRGVEIKGIVDSNVKGEFAYDNSAKFIKEFGLIQDKKSALMHNKIFVFDDKKVFTGSINVSKSGTGGYNSNTAVLINNVELASCYNSEINQMLSGKFQKTKLKVACEPLSLTNNVKISAGFSPKGDIYLNLIKPIVQNAKSEILVSAFFLTHKDLIEELIQAKKRGVKIKIIIDATSAGNSASGHQILRNAGVLTKIENWGGKNHEKNMVVDGKFFITGSANFSKSAMDKNDENVLVIENPQIANAYRNHFLKMYNSIDDKYLKTNPHPESFESGNSCYDGIDNDFDGKIDSKDEGCKRKFLL